MASEPIQCPKCGSPRERAVPGGACPSCGLRLAHWSGFDVAPSAHPLLDPAFLTLGARWDETAAHDAFLALARSQAALDVAAARYRHRLRAHPDDPQARRALDRALFLAATLKDTTPGGSVVGLRRLRLAVTVAAVFLIALVSVVLYRLVARGFPRSR